MNNGVIYWKNRRMTSERDTIKIEVCARVMSKEKDGRQILELITKAMNYPPPKGSGFPLAIRV